ncbi:hypothetical protein [Anaerostipes caccae]|nr:hypothetical protein [Anaerostipes caccae]MCB6353228.1 hypothetical protein [Anaerostipes caccae]MCB6363877.1 hypothetical protein [Anaerostipes caccae]MCB6373329.1 hypothetical protein [Anaerostipes caccae]MCB6796615.1 hypothetical protein [Anaerostipes caccae]MCB7185775.1 hypothetical protein [Anaerostipes caccae]
MKKPWERRIVAAALILAVGTGAGTILRAEDQEMSGKSGGGIFTELKYIN